jgi:hypothetical protein
MASWLVTRRRAGAAAEPKSVRAIIAIIYFAFIRP